MAGRQGDHGSQEGGDGRGRRAARKAEVQDHGHQGRVTFERFTQRARQVVVLAQDEARELRHNYIGTEHLLLGLIREQEGIAARVLDELDVEADDVRTRIRRKVGEGDVVTTGQIPFTPRAKRTLELALREAIALGHTYIGTEHVLLGLIRDEGGVASVILRELGANADVVHGRVIGTLGGPAVARIAQGGTVHSLAPAFRQRHGPRPWPKQESLPQQRRLGRVELLVAGWLLFALALGVGVLIGWAIWG